MKNSDKVVHPLEMALIGMAVETIPSDSDSAQDLDNFSHASDDTSEPVHLDAAQLQILIQLEAQLKDHLKMVQSLLLELRPYARNLTSLAAQTAIG